MYTLYLIFLLRSYKPIKLVQFSSLSIEILYSSIRTFWRTILDKILHLYDIIILYVYNTFIISINSPRDSIYVESVAANRTSHEVQRQDTSKSQMANWHSDCNSSPLTLGEQHLKCQGDLSRSAASPKRQLAPSSKGTEKMPGNKHHFHLMISRSKNRFMHTYIYIYII